MPRACVQVIWVETRFLTAPRVFVWLGRMSYGFSAHPLAVSVVGESSLIGPLGENSLVFIG